MGTGARLGVRAQGADGGVTRPGSTRARGWSRPAGPTRRWVQERKERGRIGLGQDEERKLGRLVGFGKEKKKEREKEFGPKGQKKKKKKERPFEF